ncbi:MAG: helix-hairpin-helix domain-containing protein [Bacteroidota bacterium]
MKASIQLNLTDAERKNLRKHKIRKADISGFAPDELEEILQVSTQRAREILALIDFQQIPSVGIKFAEDLIYLGYYAVDSLKGLDGARLVEEFEASKGYQIDSCVEDQFRLAVYFADTGDRSKNWWDFTAERKQYRAENGYPQNRPTAIWHEVVSVKWKKHWMM